MGCGISQEYRAAGVKKSVQLYCSGDELPCAEDVRINGFVGSVFKPPDAPVVRLLLHNIEAEVIDLTSLTRLRSLSVIGFMGKIYSPCVERVDLDRCDCSLHNCTFLRMIHVSEAKVGVHNCPRLQEYIDEYTATFGCHDLDSHIEFDKAPSELCRFIGRIDDLLPWIADLKCMRFLAGNSYIEKLTAVIPVNHVKLYVRAKDVDLTLVSCRVLDMQCRVESTALSMKGQCDKVTVWCPYPFKKLSHDLVVKKLKITETRR